MHPDAHSEAIHASAVSIDGRALLILGPSKSGKSRLALALIDSCRERPIRLIGDDRIVLSRGADCLLARPHPRIAGFIERRGLGIVAMPHEEPVPVAAIVDLGRDTKHICCLAEANLPLLEVADIDDIEARRETVLRWFNAIATIGQHAFRKGALSEQTSFND